MKNYPAALPHGELVQIFDDIYIVKGTVITKWGPFNIAFSRNMTVIKQGTDLTLINTIRLNKEGLAQLSSLGKIKHIVRLAAFHGLDDPFYKDNFDAILWSVNAKYVKGLRLNANHSYFTPDKIITESCKLPIDNASYHEFSSGKAKEGLLLLDRQHGIMISGDSLQNWSEPDLYFNRMASFMMKRMGFFSPCNFGPGWMSACKPSKEELLEKASLPFNVLLPAHGEPIFKQANKEFIRRAKELF